MKEEEKMEDGIEKKSYLEKKIKKIKTKI